MKETSYLHHLNYSLKVKVKSLSRVRLFATPWTVAHQAPPSMGFSRQEYWSGLPSPSPGDLPDAGIEPGSPALQEDAWPQVNNREGTQPHPSTEIWIKDLLSMAPPIRIRPCFPLSQPLILLLLRADTENHNHRKLTNLITWTTALSNSMKL